MRFLAWILAASTIAGAAQNPPNVSRIEITSRWGGLGRPSSSHVILTNDGGAFRSSDRSIYTQQVDALLRAVAEPPKTSLDIRDLGITQEWLHIHAVTAKMSRSEGTPDLTPRQSRFFRQKFMDENVARTLLEEQVQSRHTDDNPVVKVEITGPQETLLIVSGSQFAYMLPWRVKRGDHTYDAFNSDISRAIANLLPAKGTNRERLKTDDLAGVLAYEVTQRFEDEINFIGVEDRSGSTLAELRTKYIVAAAEINGFHHPEYGKDWEHGDPGVRNLHVTLRRNGTLMNVNTLLVLPFQDGHVLGTSGFLQKSQHYEADLDRATGLQGFIRQNPGVVVRLSYVDGASLGAKGWQTFSADMKAIGKTEMITKIAPIRDQVELMIIGKLYAESYWLLLPDGQMLLWRYNGPSGLLGWKISEAETKDCASYGELMGGCVGKIFPQPSSH